MLSSVWFKSYNEIFQRLFPSSLLWNHQAYTTQIFLSQLKCLWSLLIAIWNTIHVLTQWRLSEHGRWGHSGISKKSVLYKTSCILIQLAQQFSPLGVIHYSGMISASWRPQSSATELCFLIKVPHNWPRVRKIYRWIPLTKDQWFGKCFHIVTTAWHIKSGN